MKRTGFYCDLSPRTIRSIRLVAKAQRIPAWKVVAMAIAVLPGIYFVPLQTGGPRCKARERK